MLAATPLPKQRRRAAGSDVSETLPQLGSELAVEKSLS